MAILRLVGWFILISASMGFIFSIIFYLYGYLSEKKKESDQDKPNWKIIIFFEIITLILIIALLYFLL